MGREMGGGREREKEKNIGEKIRVDDVGIIPCYICSAVREDFL